MSPSERERARRLLVLPESASGRLDTLLAGMLPGVSRKRLKSAFREGLVRMEGRVSRGADTARPLARLEILDLPDWTPFQGAAAVPASGRSKIELIHQDELIVVAEKPAGTPSYPLHPGEGGSVAEAILEIFPDMAGVGDQPGAPGLCHRLDVETSGLLLFARTIRAFEEVRRQFGLRLVRKVYLALVAGRLEGEGLIEVPIGRRSAKRMVADPPSSLRQWPARTRWTALEPGAEATLLEVHLETGVTHQARVHLAWLGHPIIGDEMYGGQAGPRMGLHASRLGLAHPADGREVTYASRHDDEILELLLRHRGE